MSVLPALSACRTPALAWRAVVLRDSAAGIRLLENHECTRNAKFALRLIRNEQSRQMHDRGYADADVCSQRRKLLDIIDGMVGAKPRTQRLFWRLAQSPGAFSCPSRSVIRANAYLRGLVGPAEGSPEEFSEGFIRRLEKISSLNHPGQHVAAFDLFTYDWSTNARAAYPASCQHEVVAVERGATGSRRDSSSSFGTTISATSLVEARLPYCSPALGYPPESNGRSPIVPPFPESDSEDNAFICGPQEPLARPDVSVDPDIPTSSALRSAPDAKNTGPVADLSSLSKHQYESLLAQVPPQDHEQVFAELKGLEQDLLKLFDNHLCFFGRDRKTMELLIASAQCSRPRLNSMMEKIYGKSVKEAIDAIVQHFRDDNERIILDQQQICLDVKDRLLKTLPAILTRQLTTLGTFDANADRLLKQLGATYERITTADGKLNGVQKELFKALDADARAIIAAHHASLASQVI